MSPFGAKVEVANGLIPNGETEGAAVLQQARSVSIHRWLFGTAITLTVAAVPHAIWVFNLALPSALLNLHLVTTVGLWLYAELRRQWTVRTEGRDTMSELVSAAERR